MPEASRYKITHTTGTILANGMMLTMGDLMSDQPEGRGRVSIINGNLFDRIDF